MFTFVLVVAPVVVPVVAPVVVPVVAVLVWLLVLRWRAFRQKQLHHAAET